MFRKIRIDFEPTIIEFNNYSIVNPISTSITDFKNAEVSTLLENGWKLHSVIPIQGIYSDISLQSNITTGVELVFTLDKLIENASSMKSNIKKNPNKNRRQENKNFRMPDEQLSISQKVEFYQYWSGLWNWDGVNENDPLIGHAQGIRTDLINRGILSDNTESTHFFPPFLRARRNYVDQKMLQAFNSIELNIVDTDYLFDAFNAIQVWGGREGRRFYDKNAYGTRNGSIHGYEAIKEDWVINWYPFYKSFVLDIYNQNQDIQTVLSNLESIYGLGLSFGSKHLYFWSKIARENNRQNFDYPIFDTILNELFTLKKETPSWKDYEIYLQELITLKEELDNQFSLINLERALFAYCNYVKIRPNNAVPINHQNEPTILVNDFLNSRFIQ